MTLRALFITGVGPKTKDGVKKMHRRAKAGNQETRKGKRVSKTVRCCFKVYNPGRKHFF